MGDRRRPGNPAAVTIHENSTATAKATMAAMNVLPNWSAFQPR